MAVTGETYTWECLWNNHCDGCAVGEYVEREGVSLEIQKRMLDVATVLSTGTQAGTPVEAIAELYPDLSEEAVRVAINGYNQWQQKDCRPAISEVTT